MSVPVLEVGDALGPSGAATLRVTDELGLVRVPLLLVPTTSLNEPGAVTSVLGTKVKLPAATVDAKTIWFRVAAAPFTYSVPVVGKDVICTPAKLALAKAVVWKT